MKSLLPNNATKLELDIEQVIADRLNLNISTLELNSVDDCPVELLPWLAWAAGVNYWNHNWPESIKRQVIAAAPELHRIKGTKSAIVKALKALNIKAVYREWYETGAQRGTFELNAMLRQNVAGGESLLGGEQLLELQRVIESVKRGSIHYTLNVGFDYESPVTAPAALSAARVVQSQEIDGQALPKFTSKTDASLPAALSAARVVQATELGGISLPRFTSSTLSATAGAISKPVVQFDFIVREHAA